MRSRTALFVLALAGLAGWIGFASTPVALSDPAYQTASDSTLAALVPTPTAAYAYAGNDYASGALSSFFGNPFNSANAGDLASVFWRAGKGLLDIDPWYLVPAVLLGPVGGYIAYKEQSVFFHWITDQWGSNGSGALYLPEMYPVHQGVPVCVGGSATGQPVNFVPPSDGMLLYASNGSGYCSGGEGPVSWDGSSSHVWVNGVSMSSVSYSAIAGDHPNMAPVSVGAKLRGMTTNAEVWFSAQPLGVAPSGAYIDSMGTTPINTTINCTGSGPEGWGCTGAAFNRGPGSTADVAAALRNLLSQDAVAAGIVDCMLTDTCPTTSIAPTFTMPNCYGLTVSACQAEMDDLGFTGTLDSEDATTADYTQTAGVVLSTAPAKDQAESTATTATAEAETNPQRCAATTANPHWSDTPPIETMLAKGYVTCTYDTTVEVTMMMWMCTGPPIGGDPQALDDGAYGCARVATVPTFNLEAQAKQTSLPIYCPGTEPWVPLVPNYYIAVTIPTGGDPGWSQDDWYYDGTQ